jgi:hypothetical protein
MLSETSFEWLVQYSVTVAAISGWKQNASSINACDDERVRGTYRKGQDTGQHRGCFKKLWKKTTQRLLKGYLKSPPDEASRGMDKKVIYI